ncbi:MAG TPA: hypothetical protein VHB78_05645 [Vicinamibacterales bacterium]|nr:hypothetical protein [Vicinamibacterales bacterium]
MTRIAAVLFAGVLLSTTAFAQTPLTEPSLHVLRSVPTARGIAAASPALALREAGLDRQTTTSPPKRDGLANGIWTGLLVGLGVGAATIPIVCPNDDECQNVYAVVIVPIYAAGGAVVGALIDRAITDPQQTAHVSLGHSRFRVSTSARRGQRSVALGVSF